MRSDIIERKLLAITNSLYLKGYDLSHIGANDGLMGQVVFFFTASRMLGNKIMSSYAEAMLEDVCNSVRNKGTLDFLIELCDIGCAIDYLVKENYVKGDINDILFEFDSLLYKFSLRRMLNSLPSIKKKTIFEYVKIRIAANHKNSIWQDASFLSEIKCLMNEEDIIYDSFMSKTSNFLESLIQHINESKKSLSLWQKGMILLHNYKSYNVPRSCLPIRVNKAGNTGQNYLFIFSHDCRGGNYGVGTYIEQLRNCFPLKGWNIYIIKLYHNGKKIKKSRLDRCLWLIEIPRNRKSGDKQYTCSIFHYLSSQIKEYKCLVCHFNFVSDLMMVRNFKKELGAKIIFTLHYTDWSFSLMGDRNKLTEDVLKYKAAKYKHIYKEFERERLFMNECDRIIAISKHTKDTIEHIYKIDPKRVLTIYNAILFDSNANQKTMCYSVLRAKYGFNEDLKIFIFAGRLDSIKGVNSLVESYISAKKESTIPSKLIIVGDGNFQEIMNVAKGYWSDIVFTGFVDKQTLNELFCLSDYGVLPSIFEEFGYVTLEMLSNGLPIIANDTSGIAEIINNVGGGHLYNNNTENNLSNAILNALNGCIYIPDFKIERFKKYYSFETFSSCIHELLYSF